MRHTHSKWLAATILTLGLVAAGCGDDTTDSSSGGDTPTTTAAKGLEIDYASLSGTLNGSGASFQDVLQQTVKGEFEKVATGVKVNYAKSGSSAGKKDLAGGVVQFAGTDSLIKDEEKATFTGGEVLYFPIAAAPITLSYNLEGVTGLKLSADVIAGIFQAEITTWDDAKIVADNADLTLPSTPIVVVHRSDGSGTTSNFTKYLKKAAPSVWKLDSGDTVNWPAGTQGAEKNSGVATLITQTAGAIGYVDLADSAAADLSTASIKNSSGKFVEPKLPGASAALDGATVNDDLTFDPLDADGEAAYPITAPTWIIVYAKQPAEVKDALVGYLNFMLTEGEKLAPGVGYAQLPESLNAKAIAQLDKIV